MKTSFKPKVALFMLLGAAVLASCSMETEIGHDSGGKDHSVVTFRISVPTGTQSATRALTYPDEYAVETVDVLVFRNGKYAYSSPGEITSAPTAPNNSASAIMTFRASMVINPAPCDLMVVANGRGIIADTYNGGIPKETPQSAVEKALLVTMPAGGWVHDTADPYYRHIPMWSYMTGQTIDEHYGDSSNQRTINLVRMVSKVDVKLVSTLVNTADVSRSKFQLRSVRVYNYAKKGRIIPYTDGTYDWSTMTDGNLHENTTPSLPQGYPAAGTFSDGEYEYIDYPVTYNAASNPWQYLTGEIYLFEAHKGVSPASGDDGYMQNPCIVVGGNFEGSAATTYYRIDFAQKNVESGSATYMPVLRNNCYTVTVTGVTGPGHETPDEAYKSIPVNIEASVVNWTGNDITTAMTDGKYLLGVSRTYYELSGEAHTSADTDNRLTIVTDYRNGWNAGVWADEAGTVTLPADAVSGQPWLRLSQSSGNGNYPTGNEIYFNTDENGALSNRTAYIHVKAGGLALVVKVVQRPLLRPGTITVSPENVMLPYTAQEPAYYAILVDRKKSNGNPDLSATWTLKVPAGAASWLKLALDPYATFATAAQSVSMAAGEGTGSDIVYLYTTANNTAGIRTVQLVLNGDTPATVVTQSVNTNTIVDTPPPTELITYVGAFWKHDQTGERLIRIPRTYAVDTDGAWTATVIEGDWIVLDRQMTSDPNVGWCANADEELVDNGNDTGFDTDHAVSGTATTVTGNLSTSDPYIYFRIGLTGTIGANEVRYGVVLLTYNNNTKAQRLWIRQGENADYVIHPDDVPSTYRTNVKAFSPYNLTTPNMTEADYANVGFRSGVPTAYPTQAGAFWQWAGDTGYERRAWHPSHPAVSGWSGNRYNTNTWNAIYDTHETCPTGYRRPISTTGYGTATTSEFVRSLVQNPPTTAFTSLEKNNAVWGFYADGFFDRRDIKLTYISDELTDGEVSKDNNKVAYAGILFHNDNAASLRRNASLFFPAATWRNSQAGTIELTTDKYHPYWSQSTPATGTTMALTMDFSHNDIEYAGGYLRSRGYSIRCVRQINQ